jgi:hypothetical protein
MRSKVEHSLAAGVVVASAFATVGVAFANICRCENWPVDASGPGICHVMETTGHCSITFAPNPAESASAKAVSEKVTETIAKGDDVRKREVTRIQGLLEPLDEATLEIDRSDDKTMCDLFGCNVLTAQQIRSLIGLAIYNKHEAGHNREASRQDWINICIAIGTGLAAIIALVGLGFTVFGTPWGGGTASGSGGQLDLTSAPTAFFPDQESPANTGRTISHRILGGLHHQYSRI